MLQNLMIVVILSVLSFIVLILVLFNIKYLSFRNLSKRLGYLLKYILAFE